MAIEMSNKIILITEKSRITSPIKIALNSLGLDIVTGYPALTSLQVMRTGIAKSGKTAFIRKELLRFMQENGFPRAIIMDSLIDPEVTPSSDSDMLKIFKTFLIAYVILSKGIDCRNLRGNFILLTKGGDFEKKYGLGGNPHGVMKFLSSQNPEINFFIDEYRDSPDRFSAVFSISLLDTDLSSDMITDSVSNFIKNTQAGKIAASVTGIKETDPVETKKEKVNNGVEEIPARIVFRIDEGSIYDDGEIHEEIPEKFSSLKEKEFYVIGAWSSKTELDVSRKIASVIQKGISEKARFAYGDVIMFNLDDRCIIDKNTALSLAQLFTKNLSMYKKIKITASAKNGALIEKSRGYPMIRNILVVSQE